MSDPNTPSWLTPLIVILGWAVVNHQNNFRESRKEVRAQLSELKEQLSGLVSQSIEFHCGETYDSKLAISIRSELQDIIRTTIGLRLIPKGETALLRKLRSAVTLNNFDQSSWQKQGFESNILADIAAAKSDLVYALERQFNDVYCLNFFQKSALYLDPAYASIARRFQALKGYIRATRAWRLLRSPSSPPPST